MSVLQQVRTFLIGKPVGMHIPLSSFGPRAGAFMVHPRGIRADRSEVPDGLRGGIAERRKWTPAWPWK
jgi:hypothetical protein